jgi:hypothetical protein
MVIDLGPLACDRRERAAADQAIPILAESCAGG